MKTKIQFGSWESTALLVNLIFAQAVLNFPKDMVKFGKSAGWMIPVVITLLAMIYFGIAAGMYKKLGSLDLLDISYRAGGKTLKIISGLIITILLVFHLSAYLGDFAQTIKTISLDKSPMEYVALLFLLGMAAAAFYGIEAVARINAVLVPIIIVVFLLITLGVVPDFNFNHVYPLLGDGYQPILTGSALKFSVFSPFLILFFMVPFFKTSHLKKVGYGMVVISGVLLVWAVLAYILVFPYGMEISESIPIFQMARHVEIGTFIQRVESMIVLVGSLCGILFLGALFTFVLHIFTKALDIENTRPLILPMAILVFALGVILKRPDIKFFDSGMVDWLLLAEIILPLLIIILGVVKKVGKQNG